MTCFSMDCEKLACRLKVELKKEISGSPVMYSSWAPMAINCTTPADMVYYFKGRKLQIGFSTHETNYEKVFIISTCTSDRDTILVTNSHVETIDTTNRIDVLCDYGVFVLEGHKVVFILYETREGVSKHTEGSLPFIHVRGAITKNRVELFDGNITMFGSGGCVDASGEKSSLNNILQWLTEKASKGVGTILSDGINCDGVVLIVEIGDRLRGRSNESHL